MFVREVMSKAPAACTLDAPLNRAAQIMWELDCGCVPIVDDTGKAIGVITDRDICVATYTQGRSPLEISVATVAASQPLVSCRDDNDIKDAEALMKEHRVRRLPVTNSRGKLVGILSLSDLAMESVSKSKKKGITPARIGAITAAVSKNGQAD